MRPTRGPLRPLGATTLAALTALGLSALGLVGCGSAVVASGGPTSSAGSTPTATSTSAPTTTDPTSAPTTSTPATTDPSTPVVPVHSGPAAVTGTIREGVEPSCVVLGPYVLTGTESLPAAQRDLLRVGATVAVTGQVDPGMASYCQQGTLLTVTSVRALHPMTPDPRATPTIYSTP